MSDSGCIVPWSNFIVNPDGTVTMCCDAPFPVAVNGRRGDIARDSFADLWNADETVHTRRAMARGERPAICDVCWKRERQGGRSRRAFLNETYVRAGGELEVAALPHEGAATDFRLSRPPDWFVFQLGNACNLKCRSCTPLSSSLIARDGVHAAWNSDHAPSAGLDGAAGDAHGHQASWFRDVDKMADMVASSASERNTVLSLLGGEPFMVKQAWLLLEELVRRGVAHRVLVGFATNGQLRNRRLAELAPEFRQLSVSLSIDGYGPLYEYLRHGGSWTRLVDNLRWFRELPGVDVVVVPTLQNANVLDIVTLLRFLDEHELGVAFNAAAWPARLAPTNLPAAVRRVAIARLRAYLDTDCRPHNAEVVRSYCTLLEEAGDGFDEELFDEFMTFTNDLDDSRGECFAQAAPELAALIAGSGVPWSAARRHSQRPLGRAPAVTAGPPADGYLSGVSATSDRRSDRRVSASREGAHEHALSERLPGSWAPGDVFTIDGTEFVVTPEADRYLHEVSTAGRFIVAKTPAMIDELRATIAQLAPARIVDLGIFKGGSTALQALLARPVRHTAIELSAEPVAPLRELIAARDLADVVHPHYGVDQSDVARLASVIEEDHGHEPLDLVVDDASHLYRETRASFEVLFARLRPGGVYVIEDWAWAHFPGEFWQSAGGWFHDRPALTNLIVELLMVAGTGPELIADIRVRRDTVTLTRGALAVDGPLRLEDHYLNRGLPFRPLM